MKKAFLLLAFLATFVVNSFAQDDKALDIKATYYYAMGRFPSSAELNYWMGQPTKSGPQLVDNHRGYVNGNRAEKEKAIEKSYIFSFGRRPTADETKYWMGQNKLYYELVKNHVSWMTPNSSEWTNTVMRAFAFTGYSNEQLAEMKSWFAKTPIAFVELTDILEASPSRPKAKSSYRIQAVNSTSVSKSKENIPSNVLGKIGIPGSKITIVN
jgi:hypothetical protein